MTSSTPAPASIAAATTMGAVALTVADLDGMRRFYEQAIGLRTIDQEEDLVRLGADERTVLVELHGRGGAPPSPPRATGLFHLALLVPERAELARAIRRVTEAGRRFSGASDHFVSEAMYLDDPEGNGIELYRDRPREEWYDPDGGFRFGTVPLDLDAVLAEMPADPDPGMPAGTGMGHVHLRVHDIAAARAFYEGVLGFDVMVDEIPTALFISAGGYHHHLGMNVWHSAGGAPPPPESRGLRHYEVVVPGAGEVERVAARMEQAGAAPVRDADGVHVTDPSGNRLLLRAG